MTARPLLIGQAPGPNTDPDLPLFPLPKNMTGGRLAAIMGLGYVRYLKTFDRISLLPYFPGKGKTGDLFPMAPAKLAASVIKPLLAGRTVILVGRGVADAFEFDHPFHKWRTRTPPARQRIGTDKGEGQWGVVPHPSGRNRWYSDADNRAAAELFWTEFLTGLIF